MFAVHRCLFCNPSPALTPNPTQKHTPAVLPFLLLLLHGAKTHKKHQPCMTSPLLFLSFFSPTPIHPSIQPTKDARQNVYVRMAINK